MPMLVLAVLVALLVGAWLAEPRYAERRRQRIRGRPFPAAWRRILDTHVPLLRRLPAGLRRRLEQQIQVFLAEKPFIGCGGQHIDDEVRLSVAAQACLLTLNQPLNRGGAPFPNLRQILVYPGAFVVDRLQTDAAGVLQDRRQVLAGESWVQGQVILSWADVQAGAAVPDDGRNVVIHEFAHQLDQETGHANGAPALPSAARHQRWSRVFAAAYAALQAGLVQRHLWHPDTAPGTGVETLFGDYAASDPAEFFAVASEVFFEQAGRLAAEQPLLYGELAAYYRVDPASWAPGPAG